DEGCGHVGVEDHGQGRGRNRPSAQLCDGAFGGLGADGFGCEKIVCVSGDAVPATVPLSMIGVVGDHLHAHRGPAAAHRAAEPVGGNMHRVCDGVAVAGPVTYADARVGTFGRALGFDGALDLVFGAALKMAGVIKIEIGEV